MITYKERTLNLTRIWILCGLVGSSLQETSFSMVVLSPRGMATGSKGTGFGPLPTTFFARPPVGAAKESGREDVFDVEGFGFGRFEVDGSD
jgi:hypothetical protein